MIQIIYNAFLCFIFLIYVISSIFQYKCTQIMIKMIEYLTQFSRWGRIQYFLFIFYNSV